MIGAQGYYEYLAGRTAGLDLNAYATMDLDASPIVTKRPGFSGVLFVNQPPAAVLWKSSRLYPSFFSMI